MPFGNEKCKDIVENVCPYCGKILLMNKRSFANHVRWCKSNPKYQEIKNSTISKLKSHKSVRNTYTVNCKVCHKEYVVICTEKEFINKKFRHTCSSNCAHQLTVKNTDIDNKNHNISKHYKNLIKEDYKKVCPYCNKEFTTRKKNKIYCCQSCASKFRYKDSDIRRKYRNACSFLFSLNDFPQEFDFSLIEKYGWYKAKNHGNNLNGISRDHKVSVNFGFANLIDPYIISHPANCNLLCHSDNVSKHKNCSITMEELLDNIKSWHEKYGIYENKIDYTTFDKKSINFIKFY